MKQETTPIAVKGDTVEFSAGAFKTQPNAAVEDLLSKLPGLEVARDGTVKAPGQNVSRILVEGKPFLGDDPKVATKNLPAAIVDKVQVYDQQSDQAQFSGIDDGTREKTTNLTIKRDRRKGYFGQSLSRKPEARYAYLANGNRSNRDVADFKILGPARRTAPASLRPPQPEPEPRPQRDRDLRRRRAQPGAATLPVAQFYVQSAEVWGVI